MAELRKDTASSPITSNPKSALPDLEDARSVLTEFSRLLSTAASKVANVLSVPSAASTIFLLGGVVACGFVTCQ